MFSTFRRWLIGFTGVMVASIVTVALFDLAAFFTLPYRLVDQFPHYRESLKPAGLAGRGAYPHDYFVLHPERGFDIGRNKTATHRVEGETYPIWSNSMGCFDNEPAKDADYIYLVGDSHTWGLCSI